jgi:hypothetical protein
MPPTNKFFSPLTTQVQSGSYRNSFNATSPNHSPFSINPSNLVASPYGWHDTNGVTGAEYTITRGIMFGQRKIFLVKIPLLEQVPMVDLLIF